MNYGLDYTDEEISHYIVCPVATDGFGSQEKNSEACRQR